MLYQFPCTLPHPQYCKFSGYPSIQPSIVSTPQQQHLPLKLLPGVRIVMSFPFLILALLPLSACFPCHTTTYDGSVGYITRRLNAALRHPHPLNTESIRRATEETMSNNCDVILYVPPPLFLIFFFFSFDTFFLEGRWWLRHFVSIVVGGSSVCNSTQPSHLLLVFTDGWYARVVLHYFSPVLRLCLLLRLSSEQRDVYSWHRRIYQ